MASCKLFPHTALRQTAGISVHDRLSLCREPAEIQNDITDSLIKILTTIANIRLCSNYTMDIFKSMVINVNFTNLQYTVQPPYNSHWDSKKTGCCREVTAMERSNI